MERETKTLTTPVDKHQVIFYTYLTGREKREIESVFLSSAKLSINSKEEFEAKDFDPLISQKSLDKSLSLLIKSIKLSGQDKNVEDEKKVDYVLDMKLEDYNFVVTEVNKIQRNSEDKKK